MSKEERARRWPDVPVTPTGTDLLEDDQADGWYTLNAQTKERAVRVAYYYRVYHTARILAHHATVDVAVGRLWPWNGSTSRATANCRAANPLRTRPRNPSAALHRHGKSLIGFW